MLNLQLLIEKLEAWKEHDFHKDRQLADECLLADGWVVVPDDEWKGGIRWSYGINPQYSCTEAGRPHPILDLDSAVAIVPHGFVLNLLLTGDKATACVWSNEHLTKLVHGTSSHAPVAVLIAAMKAKRNLEAGCI